MSFVRLAPRQALQKRGSEVINYTCLVVMRGQNRASGSRFTIGFKFKATHTDKQTASCNDHGGKNEIGEQ